jgi:hypothetical protein
MELLKGHFGKATILKNTELWKLDADGKLTLTRKLKKGEEYRIYSYKSVDYGLFGVGGGHFIKKSSSVKYETPSKSKVSALANEEKTNLEKGQTTNQTYYSHEFYANFKKISQDGWTIPEDTSTNAVQSVLGNPNNIHDLSDVGYPGLIQWVYILKLTNSDGSTLGSGSIMPYHTVYFINGKVVHPQVY